LIFGFVRDARKKFRPIRPKPLIPTFVTICVLATHGAYNEKAQTLKYALNLPQRWGLGANTISDHCVNSSVIKALNSANQVKVRFPYQEYRALPLVYQPSPIGGECDRQWHL
jgi:hypothetical protein